jgi:hypothetical protein
MKIALVANEEINAMGFYNLMGLVSALIKAT